MLLRSSSVPSLGVLVADEDRHGSSPACHSGHRSSRALLGINTTSRAGLSLKPSLPMRRACSETDLESLLGVAGATDHHQKAGEQSTHPKQHGSLEKLFSDVEKRDHPIFSLTDPVRPSHDCLADDDFHLQSRVSCCKASSHVPNICASGCLYPLAEMENTGPFLMSGKLSASPNAGALFATSEGGLDGKDGNGNGHGRSDGPSGNSYGDSDLTDLRYKRLLQSDPQNPLLLRNYAQYLSETKHEHRKAEEYYERAILACPSDGEVLSTFAKHVWNVHNDVERAGSYFEQAVEATPEDCYVLGSYASFLWQCDDNEAMTEAVQPGYTALHGTCTTVMASA